jgi:peptidoglycan/xylan/chitin deacetylase (PgdA/CDA1 family)
VHWQVVTIKRTLRRSLARVAPAASGGTRVLLYHAIGDPDPADRLALRVTKQRFLEQMCLLRSTDCAVVPLTRSVESGSGEGRPHVAITFDDGYHSDLWAADVLSDFGFPATFFVVPRFLDGGASPRWYWEGWHHFNWDDARALEERGCEIGAHSATHPDLTHCTAAELETEVAGSKALLERQLGRPVVSFSYPYGRHNAAVRVAVERAGYRLACTSRYGANRASGPCYTVRRTEVAGTDNLADFRRKLRGQYDWLGWWQHVHER